MSQCVVYAAVIVEALKVSEQMDNWDDGRLNDLSLRVDNGFKAADRRVDRFEQEVKIGFAKVDERFDKVEREMKAGFARADDRLEKADERADQRLEKAFEKADLRLNQSIERADLRLEKAMEKADLRLDKVIRETKEGFAKVEVQIAAAEGRSVARMDRFEDRLEKPQYWIWGIGATLIVGIVVGVITHFA